MNKTIVLVLAVIAALVSSTFLIIKHLRRFFA